MTISYASSLKSTRMQDVINAIDANAAPAVIEFGTTNMAGILVTMTLAKPSFTESGGTITMSGAPRSALAGGAGIAASARIRDGGGNIIVSGLSVGLSGADINLNNTNITVGQNVILSSLSLIHSV